MLLISKFPSVTLGYFKRGEKTQKPCYHGDCKPVSPSAEEDIKFCKQNFKSLTMRKTSSNTAGGRELQKVWQMAICKNLGYHYFDTNHEFAIILINRKLLISIHQDTKDANVYTIFQGKKCNIYIKKWSRKAYGLVHLIFKPLQIFATGVYKINMRHFKQLWCEVSIVISLGSYNIQPFSFVFRYMWA